MTIGIAIRGPRAARAAHRALWAAELLGWGAIGGFCVFAILTDSGELRYATTQDGGIGALSLPDGWGEARMAALISSGPNRPEPLIQFLPAQEGVGLVTGHRLPNSKMADGTPLNQQALHAMAAGVFTQAQLEAMLAAAPALDAGLICLPASGDCLLANAPRVAGRDDLGAYLRQCEAGVTAVLHNSIFTAQFHGNALAAVVGAIAEEEAGFGPAPLAFAELGHSVPVHAADFEAVELDKHDRVAAIHSADPAYGDSRARITAVYSQMPVIREGHRIGHAATEVFATLTPRQLHPGARLSERSFLYRRG